MISKLKKNIKNPSSYNIELYNVIELSDLISKNKKLKSKIEELIENLDVTYGDADATLIYSDRFKSLIKDIPLNIWIKL